MDNPELLVKFINLLAFLTCFILVSSLIFIPALPEQSQKMSLRFFKFGIALLPIGYLFGSLQVLYPSTDWLKEIGIVLANITFTSGYFLIAKAVECKTKKSKWFTLQNYIVILLAVVFIVVYYLNDFRVRNLIIPVLQGSIVLTALIINTRSPEVSHRGSVAMNVALGAICINLFCIYPTITHTTASGVQFSILLATVLIINCATLTIAIFSLYFNDVIDKEKNEAALDSLTGAYTRKLLTQLNNTHSENAFSGSLVICDIDHFKEINDAYGHAAGDEALVEFSQVIKACIRNEDKLIRYGGEEFLILLNRMSLLDATLVAERIRTTIEEYVFAHQEQQFKITASFGVSSFEENNAIESNIRKADELLYEAKYQGRNRIVTELVNG
jgi:diguanylate cyclase (GGDEF)-like protein